MSLILLHGRLSITAGLFTFAMGAWAALLALRGRGVDGNYVGETMIEKFL